ncbi:DinB family protein [Kribbella qitaiheensis]|uniref:DinB family protein n=1 Tax=Kribbella qitaiheensis TaxID=1544730 RepID=A0A7G6X8E7_9ACTN|nr:DinB family protein [Kribbella qitaiheensis]QNE22512.1 DinB family protein [Kribbella qitaiheensis]
MTDLKAELHSKLRDSRALLLSKLDGLSEYDLRRPLVASGTNLLGLVKHLAGIEYVYLTTSLGRPKPDILAWEEDGSVWDGADMWAQPSETSEYLIDLYRRACASGDETIAALDLSAPASVPHWPEERRQSTLGVLLIRMVDETAHHAGHADIVRELIDGQGGSDAHLLDQPGWQTYTTNIQAAADTFR